jgi:hypothetical protein
MCAVAKCTGEHKKVGVGAAWWRTVRLGGIGVQGDPSLAARRFVGEAEFTLCIGEETSRAPMPAPSQSCLHLDDGFVVKHEST